MTTTTASSVRTYEIDRAHSETTFQVRHLLTKVRGHFADFSGAIEFDAEHPEASSVRFTAKAASITTNDPKRDEHLRSADFFDVEKHPDLTFVSRRITSTGNDTFEVTGDLTIHGVTRSVSLPVNLLGLAKDPWGNEKLAFEAETTLNRKDFGLNWNAALETGGFLVGDEVKVNLEFQAAARE
jgi:polyisoprenoid-binding protein YceI